MFQFMNQFHLSLTTPFIRSRVRPHQDAQEDADQKKVEKFVQDTGVCIWPDFGVQNGWLVLIGTHF